MRPSNRLAVCWYPLNRALGLDRSRDLADYWRSWRLGPRLYRAISQSACCRRRCCHRWSLRLGMHIGDRDVPPSQGMRHVESRPRLSHRLSTVLGWPLATEHRAHTLHVGILSGRGPPMDQATRRSQHSNDLPPWWRAGGARPNLWNGRTCQHAPDPLPRVWWRGSEVISSRDFARLTLRYAAASTARHRRRLSGGRG
jgi:hypothetical protein